MGNLLKVIVHAANIHDTVAGGALIEAVFFKYPSVLGVGADAGYRKTFEEYVASLGRTVDIAEKIKPKEWEILPKRWRVERTLSWLNHSRRLSKDYEVLPETTEHFIMLVMIKIMLNKIQK
jgi:transposase